MTNDFKCIPPVRVAPEQRESLTKLAATLEEGTSHSLSWLTLLALARLQDDVANGSFPIDNESREHHQAQVNRLRHGA